MSVKTSEETALIGRIRRRFGALPDLYFIRNNVGVARELNEKTGDVRHVKYGLGKGTPDLVGMLHVPGLDLAVWVAWEVKIEGETARPNQEDSHAMWRRNHALVYVVDSLDAFEMALDDARQQVRRRVRALRSVAL